MKERSELPGASTSIHAHIKAVRDIQRNRFSNIQSLDMVHSVDMRIGKIRRFCHLQDESQGLMRAAMTQLNLSVCAYHHTQSVKLARTIADLAGYEEIQSTHLAEALHLR